MLRIFAVTLRKNVSPPFDYSSLFSPVISLKNALNLHFSSEKTQASSVHLSSWCVTPRSEGLAGRTSKGFQRNCWRPWLASHSFHQRTGPRQLVRSGRLWCGEDWQIDHSPFFWNEFNAETNGYIFFYWPHEFCMDIPHLRYIKFHVGINTKGSTCFNRKCVHCV